MYLLGVSLTVKSKGAVKEIEVKLFAVASSMDLIAKAQFLNMILHNGAYGCKDCYTKESHVPSKKGHAHQYSFDETVNAARRSEINFTSDALKAYQTNNTVRNYYVIYQ